MAIETTGISTEVPALPQVELIDSDGEPLDSEWHRFAINVLIESLLSHLLQQRDDFYVGGNMFVYFSEEQARNRDFRGPDFFFVDHVNRTPMRRYWAVWQEGGRYPDMIVELLSPSTAVEDRTVKKAIYEQIFHTSEYYCYDPYTQQLEGWRLVCGCYRPIEPNETGWLWCERLNLWLGPWHGICYHYEDTWLCFYDPDGQVVPLPEAAAIQRATTAQQQAEAAQQRAETAEAELAQLRETLARLQGHEPEEG
ncbi:hypothetical protein NKDENANG_00305 [Candidatus Entotheonellaceae bacterium PAL068K]